MLYQKIFFYLKQRCWPELVKQSILVKKSILQFVQNVTVSLYCVKSFSFFSLNSSGIRKYAPSDLKKHHAKLQYHYTRPTTVFIFNELCENYTRLQKVSTCVLPCFDFPLFLIYCVTLTRLHKDTVFKYRKHPRGCFLNTKSSKAQNFPIIPSLWLCNSRKPSEENFKHVKRGISNS